MTAAAKRPRAGTDVAFLAVALGAVLALLCWFAGALAIRLAGKAVPAHHYLAGLLAFGHLDDPARAWGSPVGSTLHYWLLSEGFVLVALALVVLASIVIRRSASRQRLAHVDGLARGGEIARAAGEAALVRRGRQLRPSLEHPKASDLGYLLGRSAGRRCFISVEDSVVILGPPRSGKGLHLVIGAILDAPGAVVTTSTRADNLTATIAARATGDRPVALFDPQRLAPGIQATMRWSPIRGCEHPGTAMIRARALCADAGGGTENATFWAQQTIAAVRCLLHAAALGNREPLDLYAWSLSPVAAKEATGILVRHPRAARAWDQALDAIIAADPRQRDSTWAMVANTFASLADPDVLDAVSPRDEEHFDPVTFLTGRGTLYLLGTASGAASTSGLVAAFVEDIVETARRLAASSSGARLDPPLALVLDEAANYCLPSLSALVSEGGGTGITTFAVLQSLAQARDRWGRDAAQAIWDSAIVKLVLGGGSNADDLADLSRLIGERPFIERSESFSGSDGSRSVSLTTRERPILTSDAIRRLRFGTALLLLRAAPPILLELIAWTRRPDARSIAAARGAAEHAIEEASRQRDAPRLVVSAVEGADVTATERRDA